MQRLPGLMLHLCRIRQGVRDVPAPILGMIPSAHSSADDRSTPVTGPVLVRAGVVPWANCRHSHRSRGLLDLLLHPGQRGEHLIQTMGVVRDGG